MRRLRPLLLLVPGLLSSGCGLDLVCRKDPHSWYDASNATYTLLEADFTGQLGKFDFDPRGQANSGRKGSYSLKDGDLAWVDSYKSSHYLEERKGEGYGTIYDNGNLDLLTKVTWTDVLGDTWAQLLRVERTRCEGSIVRYDFDPDWTVDDPPASNAHISYWATEIVSDDKVTMYGEESFDGVLYTHNRIYNPNCLYKETWNYAEGGYVGESKMKLNGDGSATWTQYGDAFGSDYDYVGEDEYYIDGSKLMEYGVYDQGTSNLVARWSLLEEYDGSGAGSYEQYDGAGGVELDCDVSFGVDGANCTMECSNGSSYSC